MSMDELSSPDGLMNHAEVFLPFIPSRAVVHSSVGKTDRRVEPVDQAIKVEFYSRPRQILEDTFSFQFSPFCKELELMKGVELCVVHGESILHLLYSYRSVSLAIPNLADRGETEDYEDDSSLAARQMEYYCKIVEVLAPEVAKAKKVMLYLFDAWSVFQTAIKHLIVKDQDKQYIPPSVYDFINRLLDILVKVNATCAMRLPALQADLLRFRHALRAQKNQEAEEDHTKLISFFSVAGAKEGIALDGLRREVQRVAGYEEALLNCLLAALHRVEAGLDIMSDDYFGFHRVMLHLLLLMDGEKEDRRGCNVFKWQKLRIKPLLRAVKRYPVLPIFADLYIVAEEVLRRCPHYEARAAFSLFLEPEKDKIARIYDLQSAIPELHSAVTTFLNRLALHRARSDSYAFEKAFDKFTFEMSQNLAVLTWEGLQLASSCQRLLRLRMCWQAFMAGRHATYEEVFRRNITEEEKSLLADLVSLLISLQEGLREPQIAASREVALSLHAHHLVQQAVQGDLLPLLHRLDKRGKPLLGYALMIRNMVIDWGIDREIRQAHSSVNVNTSSSSELNKELNIYTSSVARMNRDYKEYSRRHGAVDLQSPQHSTQSPLRVVPPTLTQLIIMQDFFDLLLNNHPYLHHKHVFLYEGSCLAAQGEVQTEDKVRWLTVQRNLRTLPLLLRASSCFEEICDCSDLWLRESFIQAENIPLLVSQRKLYGDLTALSDALEEDENQRHIAFDPAARPVCTQLPLDWSLPYLLLNRTFSYSSSVLYQSLQQQQLQMTALLQIYNQAAGRALQALGWQALYDEAEAEVALLVDLLPHLLADHIYLAAKHIACRTILDRHLAKKLHGESLQEERLERDEAIFDAYLSVFACKEVSLLGRSLNWSTLLSPHLHSRLRSDIDLAIRRFEMGTVCDLPDLQYSLSMLSLLHRTLSRHLAGNLCSVVEENECWHFSGGDLWGPEGFVGLLRVVDNSLSLTSRCGRISLHFLHSLAQEVLRLYVYNYYTQRFINPNPIATAGGGLKSSTLHALFGGSELFQLFEAVGRLYRGYFGREHLAAYLALPVEIRELEMVCDQITRHVLDKVVDLEAYHEALLEVVQQPFYPSPLTEHTSSGASLYNFYLDRWGPLLRYADMHEEVFGGLRQLGNALAMLSLLSQIDGAASREKKQWIFSGPCGNSLPSAQSVASVQALVTTFARDCKVHSPLLNHVKHIEALQSYSQSIVRLLTGLHDEEANGNLNEATLFRGCLRSVEEHLYLQSLTASWSLAPGPDSTLTASSGSSVLTKAFQAANKRSSMAHFCSAVRFLFALHTSVSRDEQEEAQEASEEDNNPSLFQIYGHGPILAVGLLMHLLQQGHEWQLAHLFDSTEAVLRLHAQQNNSPLATTGDKSYQTFVDHAIELNSLLQNWSHELTGAYKPRSSYLLKQTSCNLGSAPPNTMLQRIILENASI